MRRTSCIWRWIGRTTAYRGLLERPAPSMGPATVGLVCLLVTGCGAAARVDSYREAGWRAGTVVSVGPDASAAVTRRDRCDMPSTTQSVTQAVVVVAYRSAIGHRNRVLRVPSDAAIAVGDRLYIHERLCDAFSIETPSTP